MPKKTTMPPLSAEWKAYFAKSGKKGGKARAAKLTPEQRSDIARKAAQARHAKGKKK